MRLYRLGDLPIDGDNSYHALAATAILKTGLPIITGSKFIETKEELVLLIKRNVKSGMNVWIFIENGYKKYGNWENHLIDSLKEYTVCQASDQTTSLAKISYQQFFDIVDAF
jgi:hypothetical protein